MGKIFFSKILFTCDNLCRIYQLRCIGVLRWSGFVISTKRMFQLINILMQTIKIIIIYNSSTRKERRKVMTAEQSAERCRRLSACIKE